MTERKNKPIVLMHNPKGGVGKTTLSINLAMAISRLPSMEGKKVALVDFDINGANLSTVVCKLSLDEIRHRNLTRWKSMRMEAVTDMMLDKILFKGSGGIRIAAAPFNFIEGHGFCHTDADKVLSIVTAYHDAVIIDGGPGMSDAVDMALHHATHILGVTTAEGQSLTQLAKFVNALSCPVDFALNLDTEMDDSVLRKIMKERLGKFHVVINHTSPASKYGLEQVEIEETLGRAAYAVIPYSEHVMAALHGAEEYQAMELDFKSMFSKNIRRLAEQICEIPLEKRELGEKSVGKPGGTLIRLFRRSKP